MQIDKDMPQESRVPPQFNVSSLEAPPHHQDRIYNSRYVQFDGVCHAVFRCHPNFREATPSVILLHNKTVREAKDMDRMRDIIREQYGRMIVNPALASSQTVMGWAIEYMTETALQHKFETFEEFKKAYD